MDIDNIYEEMVISYIGLIRAVMDSQDHGEITGEKNETE